MKEKCSPEEFQEQEIYLERALKNAIESITLRGA